MKKARVIVTFNCNRNCAGCCNKHETMLRQMRPADSLASLLDYDMILITGGEPLLLGNKLVDAVRNLRLEYLYSGEIILYTAEWDVDLINKLLLYIDGITITLHSPNDVQLAINNIHKIKDEVYQHSFRLNIFKEAGDWLLLDTTGWNTKHDIEWIKDCPLPADEELFYLENF
jgi:molybdenum cofactor biosynthesis enzyme MoaA